MATDINIPGKRRSIWPLAHPKVGVRIGATVALVLLLASGATGCASAPADFNSPEPAARNAAIVRAAQTKDQTAIPDLVRMLESDDPTTRVLAIRTLERLTGQTLGYHPQADEQSRKKAVADWAAWCANRPTTGG
jgi:HEAT repeat protein